MLSTTARLAYSLKNTKSCTDTLLKLETEFKLHCIKVEKSTLLLECLIAERDEVMFSRWPPVPRMVISDADLSASFTFTFAFNVMIIIIMK